MANSLEKRAGYEPASVLFTFSASGIRNSVPFTVSSSTVTVRYSYDCLAFGSSGDFIADLVSGTPGSGNYDDPVDRQ